MHGKTYWLEDTQIHGAPANCNSLINRLPEWVKPITMTNLSRLMRDTVLFKGMFYLAISSVLESAHEGMYFSDLDGLDALEWHDGTYFSGYFHATILDLGVEVAIIRILANEEFVYVIAFSRELSMD